VNGKAVAGILVVLGLVIVVTSFQYQGGQEELKLKVLRVVKGDDAIEMVKSIHIGSFDVKSAAVVELEGIGKIRVWVAYADSPSTAQNLVERMKDKVDMYFSKPEIVDMGGLKAYRVFGNGRTHYFFSFQNRVVWVEFSNSNPEYHAKVIRYLFGEGGMEKYIN